MDAFAWPLAVVIITGLFMMVFRPQIVAFLARVRKVGPSGVETASDQPQNVAPSKESPADELKPPGVKPQTSRGQTK